MTAISDLLERVEKATGPDRALDHAIYDALKPTLEVYSTFASSGNLDAHWYWMASREYTASIDAALALVERKLPGWFVTVATFHTDYGSPYADMGSPSYVKSDEGFENEYAEAAGASPALAILTALLRALESPSHE